MKWLTGNISVGIYSWTELPDKYKGLLEAANDVRHNAQAPYSHYKVGAALLGPFQGIYRGCNVERVSYTQTTHAEQNAIDNLVSAVGNRSEDCHARINAIAIIGAPSAMNNALEIFLKAPSVSPRTLRNIGSPSCGHCLQCIWENCFGNPDVPLIWPVNGGIAVTTIGDALPLRFGPLDLGVDYAKK